MACVVDENCCENNNSECESCNSPKHPKPRPILLECGCNPQDAIFDICHGHVKKDQTFVLDRVILDTTCLCKPTVKFEFSCLVYFKAKADKEGWGQEPASEAVVEACTEKCPCKDKKLKVNLLFELVRTCKGVSECVRSWRYLKEVEIGHNDDLKVEISEPFTVTLCDKTCPKCCEYKMIVKGINFDGHFDVLKVLKPDLSALAQGQCSC